MRDLRLYDSISSTYVSTRRADSRVAVWIHNALGDAERVVNVGAGTGNYEPDDRRVIAIEPSVEMIAKRPSTAAPAIRAAAEEMPLKSAAFDAALAILTVHHWRDRNRGLAEMCRVAPKQVIFLFDPVETYRFWAIDYWPEALSLPSERDAVGPNDVAALLDVVNVHTVPIPIDCTDGFGAAFWGRPEAYLDPQIQQGMSWLAQLQPAILAKGAVRLAADLHSGEWDRHHGHLRHLSELDVGYRLVTAHS